MRTNTRAIAMLSQSIIPSMRVMAVKKKGPALL